MKGNRFRGTYSTIEMDVHSYCHKVEYHAPLYENIEIGRFLSSNKTPNLCYNAVTFVAPSASLIWVALYGALIWALPEVITGLMNRFRPGHSPELMRPLRSTT